MPEEKQPSFKHIIRVANVDLPGNKPIRFALTKIRGIGINFADVVCSLAGVDRSAKTGNLSEEHIKTLNTILADPEKTGFPSWMFNRKNDYETGKSAHLTMGTLQFVQDNDIKRLKKIRSYRGIRHGKGLPVRGQRTRSNFRKSKGKVVGVAKKKEVKTGKPAK